MSDNVRLVWYSWKYHRLFIGTDYGCSVFNGKSFTSFSGAQMGIPDPYVLGFLDGPDYVNIYPYNTRHFFRYYPSTGKFMTIPDPDYGHHSSSVSPVIQPGGDTLLGNSREGIMIRNHGIKKLFGKMGQVFSMSRGERGDVWIASWSESPWSIPMPGGLFCYNNGEVTRWSEKIGINDCTVWCVYYDKSIHVLWVGTLNSGMYKIPLSAFEWFTREDLGLNALNVRTLFINRDHALWIGTSGDLLIRSRNGEIFRFDPGKMQKVLQIREKDIYKDYSCIDSDSRGNVYVSCIQSKLARFLKQGNYKKIQEVKVEPAVTQFCFDARDSLYYSDKWWSQIYRCSVYPKAGPYTALKYKESNAPLIIIKMLASGDTIWYCTKAEGLIQSIHGKFSHYRERDSSLPRIMNDICFDHHGNLIAGSNSGEVLIVRPDQDRLKILFRLHPGKDLIGNTVRFLVADNSDHLFIGTDQGLNRMDLNTLYIQKKVINNFYNSDAGYFDYTGKTAVADPDGVLWIGTNEHLLKVDCSKLDLYFEKPAQIDINELEVNYKDFPGFKMNERFSYNRNNLTFHFISPNYLNPQQTYYRYKLEGLSDRWFNFSHDKKAVFTSLTPGKYRLFIESYNTLNNSEIARTEYSFRIIPAWYRTWWFILLAVFVLICLAWYMIYRRIREIREEEKRKTEISRQLSEMEMKALQSQMNPHFIFNSINSIQGFILKNNIDDALSYLMDFAKILRQTLDNASKESISLEEEIDYIKRYLNLEQMRFDKKFEVKIILPENVNAQSIRIPPMLIQPNVENAIRHGLLHKKEGGGKLLIRFSIEDEEYLKCVVEDNGIGRERSREIESWKSYSSHKPHSTRITRDRLDLLNKASRSEKFRIQIKDLYDDRGLAAGTRVEIIIPLIQA